MGRGFILILVLCVLTGCARTGQINGRLSAPGEPAAGVKLDFKPDAIGNGGKLSTQLPSGESFSGRYAQITTSTLNLETPGDDFRSFITNYSQEVVATLSGNRGDEMRCRLDLPPPPAGLHSGRPMGECRLSSGGTISVHS